MQTRMPGMEEKEGESPILGAARRLEKGFDAVDWPVAKFILGTPEPTSRQIHCLWRILRKYEIQLSNLGIEFQALIPPTVAPLGAPEPVKRKEVKLYFVKVGRFRKLAVWFVYEERLVQVAEGLVKAFNENTPQSFLDEKTKLWIYPADVESVRSVMSTFEALDPQVDVIASDKIKEFIQESAESYEASRAETADLEVLTKIPLYPFQKAGVKWILDKEGRALVADEMGLGKTPEGLGFLIARKEALPALILCPANVRVNWVKETAKFTDLKCLIIAADTLIKPLRKLGLNVSDRPEPGYDLTIMNYNLLTCETLKSWVKDLLGGDKDTQERVVKEIALCGRRALPVLEKEMNKYTDMERLNRLSRAKGEIEKLGNDARSPAAPPHTKPFVNGIVVDEFMALGKFRTMIADESHYLMDNRSQRSMAAKRLAGRMKNVIGLTGTPVLNKPMELWSQLNIINSRIFPEFVAYGKEYCGAVNNGFGWRFSGASNLDKLEKILRSTVMIRRMKSQVLKELPPKTRVTLPIAIEGKMGQYERETKEPMKELLQLRKDRQDWRKLTESLNPAERKKYLAEHAEQAMEANRLTSAILGGIEKLKQIAVRIKFKECLDFLLDTHAQEKKLLVFTAHHETTDRLVEAFRENGIKADFIDGRVNGADREIVKESFQNGDLEIMVCGIRAVAEGLTLTASHIVVFIELDWNPSKHFQCEDRCHRIGQENPVTIYYLIAMGTIEEKLARMIDAKAEMVHSVVGEADRTLEEDGIMDALLDDVLEGK